MSKSPSDISLETITIFTKFKYVTDSGQEVKLPKQGKSPQSQTILLPDTTLDSLVPSSENSQVEMFCFEGSSFQAAKWLIDRSEIIVPAVLDFASDSHPGGGWRGNQVGTQEEALCRQSDMGLLLEQHFEKMNGGKYMPNGAVVYLPSVTVIRDNKNKLLEEPFRVGAIAAALRSTGDDVNFIRSKVLGVLHAAQAGGHRTVVLGAWGCGAFGNDVQLVARVMVELVSRTSSFDCIVFAIPRGDNLQAFVNTLGQHYNNDGRQVLIRAMQKDSNAQPLTEEVKWIVLGALTEADEISASLRAVPLTLPGVQAKPKKSGKLFLDAVRQVLLRSLTDQLPPEALARLEVVLSAGGGAEENSDDCSLNRVEVEIQAEFRDKAQQLVQQYVRTLR